MNTTEIQEGVIRPLYSHPYTDSPVERVIDTPCDSHWDSRSSDCLIGMFYLYTYNYMIKWSMLKVSIE